MKYDLTLFSNTAYYYARYRTPFRVTTMGESFHWMDREQVLDALFDITDPNGGIVIVSKKESGPLGYQKVIGEIITNFLGPKRRAGKGNTAIAVKCAWVLNNKKVLVLQKTEEEMKGDASKSCYDLPGRRVKFGEEALRRELLEGTGILCGEFEFKTDWSINQPDGLQLHILLYKASCEDDVISLSSEHKDINGWD